MPYKDPARKNENARRYREENRERLAEKQRLYREAHLEEARERDRRRREANPEMRRLYYEQNREKELEYRRRYKEENSEKIAEAKRLYRKAHPEKINADTRRRRARLLGAIGSHTDAEWQALCSYYMDQCLCCGEVPDLLTRDHVVPLIKGGSDDIENIQPLCFSCNSRKQARTIDYRLDSESSVGAQAAGRI